MPESTPKVNGPSRPNGSLAVSQLAALERQIAIINEACSQIATCDDIGELKALDDRAAVLKVAAKRLDAGVALQNEATEKTLWVRHRMGELSRAIPKSPGKRTDKGPIRDARIGPQTKKEVLQDAGLSEDEAERNEAIAAIEPEVLTAAIEEVKASGRELASEPFVKAGMRLKGSGKATDTSPGRKRKRKATAAETQEEKLARGAVNWSHIYDEFLIVTGSIARIEGGIGKIALRWDAATLQRVIKTCELIATEFAGYHARLKEVQREVDPTAV
ncbi:unnamed protein product [uncultured bacterium]|nr:unnamed protein product [uncultured bacterium]